MQLFPIFVIGIVLAADAGARLGDGEPTRGVALAAAWAPVALILLIQWILVQRCIRRMAGGGSPFNFIIAERAGQYARWGLLIAHGLAVFAFGWLDAARMTIGDLILIDEVIVALPPLLGAAATWWVHYPVERRLRDAMLVRRLDSGKPVHPMPSRGRYVGIQVRAGLLMLLVPILIILLLVELVHRIGPRFIDPEEARWVLDGATLAAALVVFTIAPLLMRALLNVRSLPPGEIRDDLMAIARRHNVQVRDILLWNTGGSMINAAVMGLFGRLRYVLVTDGLLETMNREQVLAVMAHEIGHVRRHHMPWLVITLIACIVLSILLLELPLIFAGALGAPVAGEVGPWSIILMLVAQLALALAIFGWISRRFERQADTFAVQHLSGLGAHDAAPRDDAPPRPPYIQGEAVDAMQGALETISQVHAVNPRRPSWRHGSIQWRKEYLDSLIGTPIDRPPIDMLVRAIKWAAAGVLVTAIGWWAVAAAAHGNGIW